MSNYIKKTFITEHVGVVRPHRNRRQDYLRILIFVLMHLYNRGF